MARLTLERRIFVLRNYFESKSFKTVKERFNVRFQNVMVRILRNKVALLMLYCILHTVCMLFVESNICARLCLMKKSFWSLYTKHFEEHYVILNLFGDVKFEL